MFISKFWTLLLALVAGVMLAVILLGKDVVNRERIDAATAILYKEMTKADVALKLHARSRLDVLLSVAVDPSVRRALAAASSSPEKATKVRDELLSVLRKRNQDLGKYAADMLIALDIKGEAVCQVGKNERQHGHRLAGFPAVDAALRGYLRDDIWKVNNEIYLIATRPVIEQGRYVGALVHGMKITDKLATEISPSVQLAFFNGNMMAAIGSVKEGKKAQGSHVAMPLDVVLASQPFQKQGYSEVQRIEAPDGEFMAVYSRVRGEAAHNDVGFALVTPIERMTSATEFYERAGTQDIDALPKVWIIIGVILAIALGWLWNYLEGQRPVSKLLASLKDLEKSDPKDQLNIYKYRRRVRKVAGAINTLIDHKMRSIVDNADSSSKSIDSILGKGEDVRLSSASFKFIEPSADEVPLPPPAPDEKRPPTPAGGSPAAKPPVPPAATTGAHAKPAPPSPPAAPAPAEKPKPALSPEEEQKYFQEIYQQFIELKKKLGEPTEQLTFDRFLGTLKKNRDTLMARYDCTQVKFQVYEKEGKASLKATPVK